MKKTRKKLLAAFLCLVLIICLFPVYALATVTENIDVYGGEVLLVPPEGKIKSCESVALPEGYGEADYPYAICMDVTLTDVEDNASFTIDILSNARKGKNNTLNNYICEVGFTYAQRDALIADTSAFSAKYAEITASESSLYSGSNKTYNIPVQLENGAKQIILYYYTYTQKSALLTPSSFVPPIVFILNFQKEVTTLTEDIDVYGSTIWLKPPEGKIKSCEETSVPKQYDTSNYPSASCLNITLTGVEDNASFTIDILSNARKGKNNTLNNYICEVGFTYPQRDALIADTSAFSAKYAEITASESSLYSGSNKTYNIPVQLENGVKQVILYYYTYTQKSALLTPSSFVPPIVFILNFQKDGAGGVTPPLGPPEELTDNVLTKFVSECGQLENENALYGTSGNKNATYLIVPEGKSTVNALLTFTGNDYAVTVNGAEQGAISEEKTLQVTLNAAQKLAPDTLAEASVNKIIVSRDNKEKVYTIWVVNQRFDDLPDAVTDFLCIGSQYTNGNSAGGDFGIRAVRSLVGSNYTAAGLGSGPVSLGNFGGYITYYFDNAITDDPNNPYGVDFIVFGNCFEPSDNAAEPGQVWVSEDGKAWYALAGGMHYEDYADWEYEITYTKQNDLTTAWSDNRGGSDTTPFEYPVPELYPWHTFADGEENTITLSGICFIPEATTDANQTILPRYAAFGYADVGMLGTHLSGDDTSEWGNWTLGPTTEAAYEALARNIAGNPYAGTKTSSGIVLSNITDGMDLAWAVDADGQPVDVSNKEFHYVKIVTASNINNPMIFEKSTEVNMVRVAQANGAPVGKTDAPTAVTIDGVAVALEADKNAYSVPVCGSFTVAVDAPEGANVYINNNPAATADYDAMPTHKIIRVIVQEGEKEPWIAVFNLTELDGEPSAAANAEALIAAIGTVTLDSKQSIEAARAAYNLLTAAQKALVGNYATLTAAEAAYADLTAAAEVDALIDAIGEVTLQSSASITAARDAYNALTDAQKALVKKHATLEAAEEAYAALVAAAEKEELDAAAAKGVTDKIAALGTVTLESESDVKAARAAYDALTADQKALVTNYETLTAAEAALDALKADKAAAEAVEAKINAIGAVTLGSESAITAARAAYDALNDTQKALVTNLETLTAAEAVLYELKHPSATITLDANGGTVNGKATDTITFRAENAGQALPTPVNSDSTLTFGGWYAGQIRYTAIPDRIADLTLVAQWIDAATTPADTSIYVTFRLIGSTIAEEPIDLADGDYHGAEYVTWIPTTGYTVDKNATVADLFIEATNAAGIRSVGADRGYVSTVYAPDVLGGYALSQFTNGQKSGWMYTKNGEHTNAINTETMENGDVIIFHYVDDYAWEVADWGTLGGSGWPQLSDSTNNYWNAWLDAEDTAPGGSSGNNGSDDTSGSSTSSGDKKDETKPDETPAETTTAESTVTADDGSTVKTETEKVVDTTTNEDGSVTETVTETTKPTVTTPDNVTTVTETVVETETTTDTVKNDDGSVTDKTETVEKVTETVTGEDGKQTTTVTETAASSEVTTDSVKNADGSVTNTVSTTDTVKETVTAADGSSVTTTTETANTVETTSVENADGSITETAVTEIAEKVTETVTGSDGKVTETVAETAGSKTVETTVDAEGKTTGSGTLSSTTTVKDDAGNVISTAVTEGEVAIDTDEDGTVSEVTTATTTTTDAEGNVTTETTVTTEMTTVDGSTGTVVEDGEGNTLSAVVFISQAAQEKSEETGEPVNAPATIDPDDEPTITVIIEGADSGEAQHTELEFGVKRTGPGIVAYVVKYGVAVLEPMCRPGSLIVPVEGDCEIIIADNTKTFDDVDTEKWYGYAVTFVTAREIFNGNGDGTFSPTGTMNRAMVAQVLYNIDRGMTTTESIFSDVKEGKWYYEAICWAAENGLITGYGDGTYHPLTDISRQDLVTILYRYAKFAGYETEGIGDDVDLAAYADGADVSDYAVAPMRWAIASGLIQGYADNILRPRNTATRAEVAAIMQRMVMNVVK